MSTVPDRSIALVPIGYAAAIILFVLPLLELGATVWPLRPGSDLWRIGSAGLLTHALMLPSFGVFVAMLTARTLDHRRVQIILAGFAVLVAATLLIGLLFVVMAIARARAVDQDAFARTLSVISIRTVAGGFIYVLIWSWMAIAGLRDYRAGGSGNSPSASPRNSGGQSLAAAGT